MQVQVGVNTSYDGVQFNAHQKLNPIQEIVERNEGTLCLHVGVLCKVPPGTRGLGTIGLGNGEHVSHGRNTGLQVELG